MRSRGSLRRPHARPAATLRLVCLPHAGGSPVLYQQWAQLLPPEVELVMVCLPGRLDRIGEPWPASITELAADIAAELVPLLDRPWAAFGHSMGALVGYELAELLQRGGHRAPERLFVSAREAPHCEHAEHLHELPDDDLVAQLVALGGTDPELLAYAEIRELVLPVIRGDYRLLAQYRHRPGATLTCPVTALVADDDHELNLAEAQAWARWTSGPFDLVRFPGDHFYLSQQPGAVIAAVLHRLRLVAAEEQR